MSDDTIELKDKGLSQLLKAFGDKTPVARVGIMGDKNARSAGSFQTNAEIGAIHEFGGEHMPMRSFLRGPITENLQKFLEDSGAFTKEALAEVVRTGSLIAWMKKVGIVGEQIVSEAFNSGGFGKWKPSNMTHKTNKQTLVETQQLRNSITSVVK